MKANWKTVGIVAISAALLYYPARRLYQYIKTKREGSDTDENETNGQVMKAFSPAYRGTHKVHPHHRN